LRGFHKKEVPLFHSFQPPFRAPEWAVGQVAQHEGRLYRVTRWEELPAVQLNRGGPVTRWQIWGRELSDDEMRAELLSAVDRITESGAERRHSPEDDGATEQG
jgi:hypothetical protein